MRAVIRPVGTRSSGCIPSRHRYISPAESLTVRLGQAYPVRVGKPHHGGRANGHKEPEPEEPQTTQNHHNNIRKMAEPLLMQRHRPGGERE